MFKLLTVAIIAGLCFEKTICRKSKVPGKFLAIYKPLWFKPKPVCWTDWFDRDDPSGTGDWETLSNLRQENPNKICNSPINIEAQTLSGVSVAAAGETIFKSDTTTGFVCKKNDQVDGKCNDYRVRFSCNPPFCADHDTKVCWTSWYDRDNPGGTGDWELLDNLRNENPGEICETPLYIEAVTTTGLVPALVAGESLFIYNPTQGFTCRNKDQKDGMCRDYKVRFGCPCKQPVCWTDWFDRDDPSGTGDWETLSNLRQENPNKICNSPINIEAQTLSGVSVAAAGETIFKSDTTTGFVCRKNDQVDGKCNDYRVRFSCNPPFCADHGTKVCWTSWYDRDNPSGTGDWELLGNLRNENPGEICETPLYIEAVTTKGLVPAFSTGDLLFIYNPTQGFTCRKKDQKGGMCHDYKVRFGCPC